MLNSLLIPQHQFVLTIQKNHHCVPGLEFLFALIDAKITSVRDDGGEGNGTGKCFSYISVTQQERFQRKQWGSKSVIQVRKGRTWSACWWEEVSAEEKGGCCPDRGEQVTADRQGSRRLFGSSEEVGGVGLLQGRQSEEQDYRTVAWISGLVPAPGLYIL